MAESKYCLAGVEFRATYVFHGYVSFTDVFKNIERAQPFILSMQLCCRTTYTERPDLGSIMGHVQVKS